MDTFLQCSVAAMASDAAGEERTATPMLSACSSSSDSRELLGGADGGGGGDSDDFRNNNTPPKCAKEQSLSAAENPTDAVMEDSCLYQNLLSPIDEERSARNGATVRRGGVGDDSPDEAPELPPRCPLIPAEQYGEYLSHKSPPDDLGEYVTLKAPEQSINSFFEGEADIAPASILRPDMTIISNAPFAPAQLSTSFMSDASTTSAASNQNRDKLDSPAKEVRYARSDVISELYTKRDKSLLDISHISNISASSMAPSSLSDSVLLEKQPLNSTTLYGPSTSSTSLHAKQRFSFSDDDSLLKNDETFETALDSTLEGDPNASIVSAGSRLTSRSDPSASAYCAPNTTQQLSMLSRRSQDDHFFINPQTDLTFAGAAMTSHRSSANQSLISATPAVAAADDDDPFRTPTNPVPRRQRYSDPPPQQSNKLEPTLCREHGLHPVFGDSPCIFEGSRDIDSDDSDLDFTSTNYNSSCSAPSSKPSSKRNSLASTKRSSWASTKLSSKRSSVARHNSVVDTDCDSSYLSECVDDTHFANDFSEAENYTAMYDPQRARMRIMRRQTGHSNIRQKRYPVGLSSSDLLESSQPHLSINATRASMPDLHGLSMSTAASYHRHHSCDELSEDNIRHHQHALDKTMYDHESFTTSQNEFNFDDDDTTISESVSQRRPLSVCTSTTQATTTTDESPESHGAMTVPVNSPNITDSGGSSSRQPTTDDYVDVPVNLPKMAQMLENRLQSHTHHPAPHAAAANAQRNRLRRRYPGSSAESSQPSLGGSKQSLHICSDPVPDAGMYLHHNRSRHRVVRRAPAAANRKGQSHDSGFTTQDSSHRPRASRAAAALRATQLYDQRHYSEPSEHLYFTDNTGVRRAVPTKPPSVTQGLNRERKKALAKKLKQFNNNFYGSSSSSLQIKTLGHF